jgi:Protein of unknown function (DUF2865)
MIGISGYRWGVGAILAALALGVAPGAQARDFFTSFFNSSFDNPAASQQRPEPSTALPFASPGGDLFGSPAEPARPRVSYGGGQAYCVRTCDGRYFPITAGDGQSRAASCNNFCPASETKVVYGSTIDHAATESGKSYSELPNAFRYRNEIVAGCTCNGKDQIGLAPVRIEDDPTLRKGDIIASGGGLMIAGRGAEKRGASLTMSPVPPSVRSRYQRVPVVASQ